MKNLFKILVLIIFMMTFCFMCSCSIDDDLSIYDDQISSEATEKIIDPEEVTN